MIPSTEGINQVIRNNKDKIDTNLISDGYHTIGELYDHRIINYITVCKLISINNTLTQDEPHPSTDEIPVWRSKVHSDGSIWDGWFLLGINKEQGKQITYHLPEEFWIECNFAETLDKAPEFDGHTSADVLERLMKL